MIRPSFTRGFHRGVNYFHTAFCCFLLLPSYTLIRFPKNVILKLNRRKDLRGGKQGKVEATEAWVLELAGVKIYMNESLCPYYKKLWTNCRKLWDPKRILSFWVSNGSIRVNLASENVSIITHDCDLEKVVLVICRYLLDFISTDMVNVCVLIMSLVALQNLRWFP